MDTTDPWQNWIDGLRAGDRRTVNAFCQQYGPQLERVAQRRIAPGLGHRVGAESVVQSACRTFLRRASDGQFELADPDGLWRLLCAITLTKVREQLRYHTRQRRAARKEVYAGPDQPAVGERYAAQTPNPAEVVLFADQLDKVLAELGSDEERQVLTLKLQDLSSREVADRLGCSERTVRRVLGRIRQRFEDTLLAA